MQNPSFKDAYDKLYYRDEMRQGEKIDDQARMFALMSDLTKCNTAIGYTPTKHDQASMAMYQVMMHLYDPSMASYKGFKVFSNHKDSSKLILELYELYKKYFDAFKEMIGLAYLLRNFSHPYMKHGEFDVNDEARRVSEDMQQFHNANPDADLSDQYYWDDVLDAKTDRYLDD